MPEPPVIGVSGTWPVERQEARAGLSRKSNSGSMTQRRKMERISESKLRGIVKYNLVALLTRGSVSSRVVGPSHGAVHDDR